MMKNQLPMQIATGFSLVEVALALGILGFAVVGIVGLLPTAMKTSLQAQREVRATQIARKVIDDLRAPGGKILLGSATNSPILLTNVLSSAGPYIIGFGPSGEGLPEALTPGDWTQGASGGCEHLARITITPNAPATRLSRIHLEVAAPAVAAETRRTEIDFYLILPNE